MIKLSDELHIPTMGEVIRDREAASKKTVKRYAAANASRLNSGWTTTPLTANFVLSQGVRILRARAREMAADYGPFKKFLTKARSNIVGQNGIQLQCRAKNQDTTLNAELNKRVENAFYAWTFAETCTVTGKLDWIAAQRLFVTQLARDGEVLVQKVKANNEFGFSLKFIDVSYLDENYNIILPSGNRVLMSVEIDDDNKPVAYWLTTPTTDILMSRKTIYRPVRVPAEELIHAFLVYDDESQVRGVTWFSAALLQGKSLQSFVEGVVTQARMTAMSLGFIEEDVPETEQFTGELDADGRERPIEIDFAPGSFTKLNPGQRVTQWDPKQPTQNHAEFKKSMEGDVATALDLPYFDLFGDMSAVNYSSARVGLGEARDIWRDLQDFVATKFCREVYHAWLPQAMLNGQLKVTAKEYQQIRNPYWRARRWPYVDPQKEITADVTALENKLKSWTEVLADKGIDLVDHLETLQQEQILAKKYGVELIAITSVKIADAGTAPADEEGTPAPAAKAPPPKRELSNGHDPFYVDDGTTVS